MDKGIFLKEVEKIFTKKENPELRKSLDIAYDMYRRIQHLDEIEQQKAQAIVKEILEYFFKDQFSENYSVPMEFIESETGKVVFGLKFGVPETAYTTAEITAIMDKTRALISYDYGNGVIEGIKKGRNIIIYEKDLIKYMKSKGLMESEIQERLTMFKQLKEKDLSLDEIKVKIKEKYDK